MRCVDAFPFGEGCGTQGGSSVREPLRDAASAGGSLLGDAACALGAGGVGGAAGGGGGGGLVDADATGWVRLTSAWARSPPSACRWSNDVRSASKCSLPALVAARPGVMPAAASLGASAEKVVDDEREEDSDDGSELSGL